MSTATLALGPRSQFGPALGHAPLPVAPVVVSAIVHFVVIGGLVLAATLWPGTPTKTYVVNLVPSIAAVGSARGRSEPSLPPRTEPPTRVARATPEDLPQRELPREPAPPPDMPTRPRDSLSLPDRNFPSRAAPALPRPGDKELPTLPSAPPRPPATATTGTIAQRQTRPSPLGQVTGSPQGAGALTLDVSDFPYAWYLSRVQAKISERWEGRALQGHQPIAFFEIARNGQVGKITIEKTSGNPYYDQAALRAITEASPFPPLPDDYTAQVLRVHLGFAFTRERG